MFQKKEITFHDAAKAKIKSIIDGENNVVGRNPDTNKQNAYTKMGIS